MQPTRNVQGCEAEALSSDQLVGDVAVAKRLLEESKSLDALKVAVGQALRLGMSLHEIESYLDQLEFQRDLRKKEDLGVTARAIRRHLRGPKAAFNPRFRFIARIRQLFSGHR